MRRQIVLAAVLAASTAIMGACGSTPVENTKPTSTPATTPAASPSVAPSTSPATTGSPKTATSPEVKKPDAKTPEVNKGVKPETNTNHK